MDWLFFSEIGLAGLGSGGLYALTGLALVLIYKATRVVNMAIGEILMLGAYVFMGFSAGLALPIWASIILAILVTGVVGGVVERAIIRPMLGESAISIFMITIGLGSVLIGVVEIIWGQTRSVSSNLCRKTRSLSLMPICRLKLAMPS